MAERGCGEDDQAERAVGRDKRVRHGGRSDVVVGTMRRLLRGSPIVGEKFVVDVVAGCYTDAGRGYMGKASYDTRDPLPVRVVSWRLVSAVAVDPVEAADGLVRSVWDLSDRLELALNLRQELPLEIPALSARALWPAAHRPLPDIYGRLHVFL